MLSDKLVTVTVKCSVLLMVTVTLQCSVLLWSLSLWSVQCSLWSQSLCSLPSLCSGNERPKSSYSLTSKRCSSQSLLPFQHSAVPKILQSVSTAIKPSRRYTPGAASSVQNYCKIFAVTAFSSLAPLQTCQHIYNAI